MTALVLRFSTLRSFLESAKSSNLSEIFLALVQELDPVVSASSDMTCKLILTGASDDEPPTYFSLVWKTMVRVNSAGKPLDNFAATVLAHLSEMYALIKQEIINLEDEYNFTLRDGMVAIPQGYPDIIGTFECVKYSPEGVPFIVKDWLEDPT